MLISKYFHLEEMTHSQTAIRLGLKNEPSDAVKAHMLIAAKRMDAIRELLGHPVIVSSWFRSKAVNKANKGSDTSDHPNGWAVDFICPGFGDPLKICQFLLKCGLSDFDQLIQEGTWVHISFNPRCRREILTRVGKNKYKAGL